MYLKGKDDTLYFVFYSLAKFTRKGLGLGEQVIGIVNSIAQSQTYENIGVLTAELCNISPYYEKKNFEIVKQSENGSIWMKRKVEIYK